MAEGVGSIGGGGVAGSFEMAGPPAGGGFETQLDEVSVVGDPPGGVVAPSGPGRQSSTSPSILAQQTILNQSQAGDAAAAQTFGAFSSANAARGEAAQTQFDSNQAALNASTAKLFAGPGAIGPTMPPGGAFGLDGPVAPQGRPAGADPALAAAGVAALPAEAGGAAGEAALGRFLAAGGDLLGGLALRAGGLGLAWVGLGTGNIPDDAQERAMQGDTQNSPTYANGSPRLLYPGAPVLNPTPLAEQATPLTPPTLTDGFTVPPPPATLTPPAPFTPIPGAVAQPLPGFTPAPALPGIEGLTPTLPQGFGPLPGFAAAPPTGLAIPGFTPAGQTPALPGFGAIEPGLTGALIAQNNGAQGVLTGSLNDLTTDERAYAEERLAQGDNVTVVPRGVSRTPDFEINGVRTELKTVSGIRNQTEDGLSAAISNRILNARGQSGTVIIDARQQPGMTQAAAERALNRAFTLDDNTGAKLVDVTVLTPNGPVNRKR